MEADVRRAAAEYFEQKIAPEIFPEMRETVRRLLASGCDIWVVSSTSEWVIQVAMKFFDIPENRILAATVRADQGRITGDLTRLPSGPGKARAIREVVGKDPDAAFGNSRWDADMLAIARHPFAVNPSRGPRETGRGTGLAALLAGLGATVRQFLHPTGGRGSQSSSLC